MAHANISHNPHICLSPSSVPPFPSLADFHTDPYSTCTCRAVPSFSLTYLNPIHFLSFICTCSLLPFHTLCASSIFLLLLPGSGVNCSLVVEQQEPRRTSTTARRDGRRQQQFGGVGGHGRRGTGACSAPLTTLPRHGIGVPLNSLCTCLLKWIKSHLFFVAINRFTAAPFF